MKRVNPVKDNDWEQVQRLKTDGFRTIDEMKEKAKELHWKPKTIQRNNYEKTTASNVNNVSIGQITARPGTVAYLVSLKIMCLVIINMLDFRFKLKLLVNKFSKKRTSIKVSSQEKSQK